MNQTQNKKLAHLKIFSKFAPCKVLKNILLLTQKTCKDRKKKRTFKYFLAQHITALNQLIFSLFLCCGLFSFAQEENSTTLYVNPNTTIVGLDYLSQTTKFEKDLGKLYIVENTIFFSSQDLITVIIESNNQTQKFFENYKHKVSKKNGVKTKEQFINAQSKTQVKQTPFPFSLPTEQKQTLVTAISITTVTPSTFSKTVSKAFTIQNGFSLPIRKMLSQKQNTVCYNKYGKPFQVKTKHCNRPPPALYC